MGKWEHRLLEKDTNEHKGICAKCGPVDLVYKGRFAFRENPACKNGANRHRKSSQHPGMTRNAVRALVQGTACAICGEDAKDLDHDHATGAIREPLCQTCNVMLGMAKDSPERLRAGAAYLERHAQSPL